MRKEFEESNVEIGKGFNASFSNPVSIGLVNEKLESVLKKKRAVNETIKYIKDYFIMEDQNIFENVEKNCICVNMVDNERNRNFMGKAMGMCGYALYDTRLLENGHTEFRYKD